MIFLKHRNKTLLIKINNSIHKNMSHMEALSEITWSIHKINEQDFLERKDQFMSILDVLGINYAEREIAEISDRKQRAKITYAWYNFDQDLELRRNEELKEQKLGSH